MPLSGSPRMIRSLSCRPEWRARAFLRNDSLQIQESAGWFPVVTAFTGWAAGLLTEWFRDSRIARRERDASVAKRADDLRTRRVEFQRQTLLDLREAMFQLARAEGAIHHQDDMTFRKTGVWGRQPVSDELSERHRAAMVRIACSTRGSVTMTFGVWLDSFVPTARRLRCRATSRMLDAA